MASRDTRIYSQPVRKILILGASGFIGAHLCQLALRSGNSVQGTFFTNNRVQVPGCKYHKVDVREKDELTALFVEARPELVIHIAGTKDLYFCEQHPQQAAQTHVQGTKNVVDACLVTDSRLVYISTDCVFDGGKPFYSEDDIPNPFNQYGKMKYEGELILLESRLNMLILRTSLLFGWILPTQTSNTVMDVYESLSNNRPIQMPTVLYNTPLYVGEAASVILKAALSNLKGVFHLAGKERLNRFELARNTASEFGYSSELIHPTNQTSGIRPVNSCLNPSRLEKAMGIGLSGTKAGLRAMRLHHNALADTALVKDMNDETRAFPRSL